MNPFLEAERARKRESLLKATEADLATITAATQRARRPLRGQDNIALRVGKVLNRRKVAKHFTIAITDDSFSYHRNQDSIDAEAKLDGIYVLRTSVAADELDSPEVVSSYKALAQVERAFRAFNTDLDIRPIRHRHRGPGPRLRVPADDLLLHHLAHAGPARTRPVHRRRQASRPGRPHQPGRPRRPLPQGPGQSSRQAHQRRPPGTSQGCLGGSGPGSWLSLVPCQHPMPSRDRRQPGHGRGRRSRAARSPCISTRSDAGISPSACAGFRRYSTRGTGPGSPRTPRALRWWLRSSAAARPGPCTTRRQVFPPSSRRSRPPSALSIAALSWSAAICGYMQPEAL